MIAEFIVALVIMVLSFGLTGAVSVPIVGAIVRLRANYAPRGLALADVEAEGGDPRTGPVVRRFWGMLMRVKRLEGWKGLYKGLVPYLAFSFLISLVSIIFIGSTSSMTPKGTYQVPEAGGLRMTLFSIFLTLVSLPMTVIINRSIVTPHLLPWSPVAAASLILTPFERSRPWVIFKAPGILAATTLQVIWMTGVAKFVRSVVVEELSNGILKDPSSSRDGPFARVRTGHLLAFLVFQAASTLILCPLEVIAVRLSVQRQNAPGEISTGEVPSEYAAKEEDVIGLRGEEEPYSGLIDAARTIYAEEGFGALYAAWVFTLLGVVGSTFV